MTQQELEKSILDLKYVIKAMALRKEGHVTFNTKETAEDFFIKFLTAETTVGVHYKDNELLDAYNQITELVSEKKAISSIDLPYHCLIQKPKPPIWFKLEGKEIIMQK